MALTIQERLKDLRVDDEMIDLLKSGRIDTALLCELAKSYMPQRGKRK